MIDMMCDMINAYLSTVIIDYLDKKLKKKNNRIRWIIGLELDTLY